MKTGIMATPNPRTPNGVERMTPREILEYVEQLGKDIQASALAAQAMLAIGADRGIGVDLTSNTALGAFEALGPREIDLVGIRAELLGVTTAILHQGVAVTYDEVDERLKQMGKPSTTSLYQKS